MSLKKFIGLAAALLFCVIALVLSPWGTGIGLSVAQHFAPSLQIDYRSGGLLSTIALNSLTWQDDSSQIEIQDIQLALDWSCAYDFDLCIDFLKVKALQGTLRPSNQPATETGPTAVIRSPIPIWLKQVQIGQLDFTVEDQLQLRWQSLKTTVHFDQQLDIQDLAVQDLQLQILQKDTGHSPVQAEQEFDFANWQYQPISLPDIVLPIEFKLRNLQITTFGIQLPQQQKQLLDKLVLQASGKASDIELTSLKIQSAQGQLQAQGKVTLQDNYPHAIALQLKSNIAKLGELNITATSKGDLANLRSELHIKGISQLDATIDTDLTSPDLPLQLAVDWQHLSWPLDLPIYRSAQGQLSARGDFSGLKVTAELDASAQDLPPVKLSVALLADRKALSVQQLSAQLLDGELQAKGRLDLVQALNWQGDIELSHINPGVYWQELKADINGTLQTSLSYSSGNLHAELSELDLHGLWRSWPLQIGGGSVYNSQSGLSIKDIELVNGNNSLTVNGTLDSEQNLAMQLVLDAQALEQSLPLLQGQLQLQAQLRGTTTQPQLSFAVDGKNVNFMQWQTEQVIGKGSLSWDDVKPINLQLTFAGISDEEVSLDSAIISIEGNAAAHDISMEAQGPLASLKAKLTGELTEHSWQGQWLFGDIQSEYANLVLAEAFHIDANWQAQTYRISPHCWQQQESSLCINQAEYAKQQALWDIAIDNLAIVPLLVRHIPALPPVKSDSELSLTLSGKWSGQGLPQATLHAQLSPANWTFKQKKSVKLALESLTIDGALSASQAQLVAHMQGPEIGSVNVNFTIDPQPGERPIGGIIQIQDLNLQPFLPLVPQLQVLAGRIDGETNISGTLSSPLLVGQVNLLDGALAGEGIPIKLTKLHQQLVFAGQQLDFSGGFQLGEGKGEASGQLSWQSELSGRLNVTGEELEVDFQSILRAKVSPHIELTFAPDKLDIKGDITVPYARFKLRELPPSAISPSKDVIMLNQQEAQNELQQKLAMHLTVKVDPQHQGEVKIDAFGLTSNLQGELLLRQGKQELQGDGEMQLVNGRYRAYGQNLLIKEGQILFNGPLDRPYLNVEAIRDPKLTADGVIAGIRIQGSVDRPAASIFSEPAMEQKESLSYLLRGHSTASKGSEGEDTDTMLANALLGFGLGKSENTVTSIGSKLGLKDLNLDTSGQGTNTQLNISGYIAPGVQLRYGIGVFDSASEVALRYQLMPQLYLEAVSGVNNALDLYYRFSIDE
jgi:translocation and assembly module TamB